MVSFCTPLDQPVKHFPTLFFFIDFSFSSITVTYLICVALRYVFPFPFELVNRMNIVSGISG